MRLVTALCFFLMEKKTYDITVIFVTSKVWISLLMIIMYVMKIMPFFHFVFLNFPQTVIITWHMHVWRYCRVVLDWQLQYHAHIYEGKPLNNRNFILKCMEKYAQRKILFRDTKWLLSNMSYRGRDDQAVWACAVGRTTWELHCQLAPW